MSLMDHLALLHAVDLKIKSILSFVSLLQRKRAKKSIAK